MTAKVVGMQKGSLHSAEQVSGVDLIDEFFSRFCIYNERESFKGFFLRDPFKE